MKELKCNFLKLFTYNQIKHIIELFFRECSYYKVILLMYILIIIRILWNLNIILKRFKKKYNYRSIFPYCFKTSGYIRKMGRRDVSFFIVIIG